MPPKRASYATPALDKGLDVIELLAREPHGLTKSEIARNLNRTVSEIFRMLLCLERRGYIAVLDRERYSLTLKMFRLVHEHPPTERLITEALIFMQHFAHDSRQSCHLAVVENARVVILAQMNAPTHAGFYVRQGSVIDIMESASGYVILAHQSASVRDRILSEWSRETGKKLPSDLSTHLARIRKAGHERRRSYQVKGVVNLSFPIVDTRGSALAALTVPYIQHAVGSVPIAAVTKLLGRTCAEISRAVGGSPDEIGLSAD
jgi:DNA-binding IclR family transcriptional regulator